MTSISTTISASCSWITKQTAQNRSNAEESTLTCLSQVISDHKQDIRCRETILQEDSPVHLVPQNEGDSLEVTLDLTKIVHCVGYRILSSARIVEIYVGYRTGGTFSYHKTGKGSCLQLNQNSQQNSLGKVYEVCGSLDIKPKMIRFKLLSLPKGNKKECKLWKIQLATPNTQLKCIEGKNVKCSNLDEESKPNQESKPSSHYKSVQQPPFQSMLTGMSSNKNTTQMLTLLKGLMEERFNPNPNTSKVNNHTNPNTSKVNNNPNPNTSKANNIGSSTTPSVQSLRHFSELLCKSRVNDQNQHCQNSTTKATTKSINKLDIDAISEMVLSKLEASWMYTIDSKLLAVERRLGQKIDLLTAKLNYLQNEKQNREKNNENCLIKSNKKNNENCLINGDNEESVDINSNSIES